MREECVQSVNIVCGWINILGLILGILGLIATLVSLYFTYMSFINPLKRFKKYLKKPWVWEQFTGINKSFSTHRHKKYPFFQITVNFEAVIRENYHEEWMSETLFPKFKNITDTSNESMWVIFEVNGSFLDKEIFLNLDDGRWLVPQPRIEMLEPEEGEQMKKRKFYYDTKQIQLAKIIGKIHPTYAELKGWDIYKFAKECDIEIKEDTTSFLTRAISSLRKPKI